MVREERFGEEKVIIYEKPYFMSDASWYYFDEQECCYKLTDKAPEKARKSYREFYDKLNSDTEEK